MYKKSFIFLVCLFVLVGLAANAQQGGSNTREEREEFVNTFDLIHGIVAERYCHFEDKNIDPSALYNKYSALIKDSDDITAFKLNMLKYFAELKNSHSKIFFDRYGVFCETKLIGDRVFVNRIYKKDLYPGIHEHDEIIEVDNVPVMEWIDKNKTYFSSSTEAFLISQTAESVFFSWFPVQRKYLIKSNNGVGEITLDLAKIDAVELYGLSVNENVKSTILEENIGYIALNSMGGSLTEFETEYFKVAHLPYLIVDVRRNTGGNSGLSEEIWAYFLESPQEACVSGRIIQPNPNYYKGKFILLIDVATGSAAESFVLDIKESSRGIIAGMPTMGDTGNGPIRGTLNGAYGSPPGGGSELRDAVFMISARKPPQISPKGFPMEGIGIPPDYYVETNAEDYLNNVDTILKYAIELIRKEEIQPKT